MLSTISKYPYKTDKIDALGDPVWIFEQPDNEFNAEMRLYFPDSPYYQSVGMVDITAWEKEQPHIKQYIRWIPIMELYKFREFDRKTYSPQGDHYYEELKKEIEKNGIITPLSMYYGVEDKRLSVGEGNHRIGIALDLGIEALPVYVKVARTNSKGIEVNPKRRIHYETMYTPQGKVKVGKEFWVSMDDLDYGQGDAIVDKKIVGDGNNSKKSSIFGENLTRDDIIQIFTGEQKVSYGENIQAVSGYVRASKGAGGAPAYTKSRETASVKGFADKNRLIVSSPVNYFRKGNEQLVFLSPDRSHVLKINNLSYYSSWEEYFNGLLLHNLFFPETAYELVGFTELGKEFFPVVKQAYVKTTEKASTGEVSAFLAKIGFEVKPDYTYYNPKLNVILKDLHDENVLIEDGVLFFIDTVFYFREYLENIYMETGGSVPAILSFEEFCANLELPKQEVVENLQEAIDKLKARYDKLSNTKTYADALAHSFPMGRVGFMREGSAGRRKKDAALEKTITNAVDSIKTKEAIENTERRLKLYLEGKINENGYPKVHSIEKLKQLIGIAEKYLLSGAWKNGDKLTPSDAIALKNQIKEWKVQLRAKIKKHRDLYDAYLIEIGDKEYKNIAPAQRKEIEDGIAEFKDGGKVPDWKYEAYYKDGELFSIGKFDNSIDRTPFIDYMLDLGYTIKPATEEEYNANGTELKKNEATGKYEQMAKGGAVSGFEIIPDKQTPKTEHIPDAPKFIEKHKHELADFLAFAESLDGAAALAANQVSFNGKRLTWRVFAIKNSTGNWELIINPDIVEYLGEKKQEIEGCLSFKHKKIEVERYPEVKVKYYCIAGILKEKTLTGFMAQVFQHEIEHLSGIPKKIVEKALFMFANGGDVSSALNQPFDLLGERKDMIKVQFVPDDLSYILRVFGDTPKTRNFYKKNIEDRLNKGKFDDYIQEGRMTAEDVVELLESIDIEVPKHILELVNKVSPIAKEIEKEIEPIIEENVVLEEQKIEHSGETAFVAESIKNHDYVKAIVQDKITAKEAIEIIKKAGLDVPSEILQLAMFGVPAWLVSFDKIVNEVKKETYSQPESWYVYQARVIVNTHLKTNEYKNAIEGGYISADAVIKILGDADISVPDEIVALKNYVPAGQKIEPTEEPKIEKPKVSLSEKISGFKTLLKLTATKEKKEYLKAKIAGFEILEKLQRTKMATGGGVSRAINRSTRKGIKFFVHREDKSNKNDTGFESSINDLSQYNFGWNITDAHIETLNKEGRVMIRTSHTKMDGKLPEDYLEIIKVDSPPTPKKIKSPEPESVLLKPDSEPKPAHLMTLDEYQKEVTPLLQEYYKFARKNEEYLSQANYNGVPYYTFEEVREALKNKTSKGEHFRYGKMDDDYRKGYTVDELARDKWSYQKTRHFNKNYEVNPTPKEVTEKKNAYLNRLREYFTDEELHSRVEKDETKSNKRSVRRAIDNDTYKNLLREGKVTEAQLKIVADSVGVKLPSKIFDPLTVAAKKRQAEFDAVYDQLPQINKAVLVKMIEEIKEFFKPLEEEIYISETKRYNKLIKDILVKEEIKEKHLSGAIDFYDDIFHIGGKRTEEVRVPNKRYGGDDVVLVLWYSKLSLKNGWEGELDKQIRAYIEDLRVKLINSIITNFIKITLPIKKIEQLYLHKGAKGFEGAFKFDFENGSKFTFYTEAIGAGGYNIQCFHYRYLTHFAGVVLADGTEIKAHGLWDIVKNFSTEPK